MNKRILFRSAFLAMLVFGVSPALAQPGPSADPPGRMFAGETMKFEGRFNKLGISFSVAELNFESSLASNGLDLVIKGEAVSKGTLTRLFRFSFLQQYSSTVELTSFRILKTTKHDVQKTRVRDSEAIFDYGQHRVTFVETDPKDSMRRPPRRIASEIGDTMNDMVSGIYSLRMMKLKVGDRLDLTVSDSGLIFKVPVSVTGREQVKTILGKVWCLKVEPDIFGTGRLIETQEGKMIIWMTDDERHVPVRTQVNASIGKAEIRLKAMTPGK